MKMNTSIVAGCLMALAGLSTTAAPAAAAPASGYYEYIGILMVTGVGAKCAANNIHIGRQYTVRILPPSLGANPANFRFNTYDREYGEMVFYPSVPGASFLSANQAAFGARGYGSISPLPQMLLTTKPASYSTATESVAYEGRIKNFVNSASTVGGQCDISFRASGVLRP